jgi:hypothetical protein|tara:strand:- start:887 stop:1168 length:282 start_codon:yes stop_codon:yes gene_type:complete
MSDDPIDIFNSVSVIITPHKKGFTCGVIDSKPPEDRDICSYIAKGLIRFVTTNADIIYEEGMQGFYEDDIEHGKKNNKDNVVDLFNFKKGDLN